MEAENADGQTALHLAVSYGHCDTTALLLKRGAHPHARDKNQLTPLHYAAAKGLTEEVSRLIRIGCNVDSLGQWTPESCLQLPSLHGLKREVWQVLFDKFALEFILSDITPLHLAAANGHLSTIHQLVQLGASVDTNKDKKLRVSPLHIAVLSGNHSAVEQLILLGADVDSITTTGVTPLYLAVLNKDVKTLELLVRAAIESGVFSRETGMLLLALAWSQSTLEVFAVLVKAGVRQHVASSCQYQLDCRSRNYLIDKPLSKQPIELPHPNSDQPWLTPLMLAIRDDASELDVFPANSTEINAKDLYGHTALGCAIIICKDEEIALSLLKNGAIPNVRYKWYEWFYANLTMLRLAVLFDKQRVGEALIARGASITEKWHLSNYSTRSERWQKMKEEMDKYRDKCGF